MEVITGNSNNFDSLIEKGNVLVDFYADWCGPCKMLEPELEKVKDEIQIIKVNVDENMELCKRYGVMTIPTIIYFKDKDIFNSSIGYINSDQILDFIKK